MPIGEEMPRYRITLDNGQSFVKEDARNFKDFADQIVGPYKKAGKNVAQITNLDYHDGDLGVDAQGNEETGKPSTRA